MLSHASATGDVNDAPCAMAALEVHSSGLQRLPACIGRLHSLQTLDLDGCSALTLLPESIGHLTNLQTLNLRGCWKLERLPAPIQHIHSLEVLDMSGCGQLKQLSAGFGHLRSLHTLDMTNCTSLQQLPASFGQLASLQVLVLRGCSMLEEVPESSSQPGRLQTLDVSGCPKLKRLPASLGNSGSLLLLNLQGCISLDQLPDLSSCEHLDLIPPKQGTQNGAKWFGWVGKLFARYGPRVPIDHLPPALQEDQPEFVLDQAEALSSSMSAIAWIAILLATASYVGFISVPGDYEGSLVSVMPAAVPAPGPAAADDLSSTDHKIAARRSYFISNLLTFFFSMATSIFCVVENMPKAHAPTAGRVVFTMIFSSCLLFLSTIAGACTFLSGVFAVYPQAVFADIIFPTLVGLACIVFAFCYYGYRIRQVVVRWNRSSSRLGNILVTSPDDCSGKHLKAILSHTSSIQSSTSGLTARKRFKSLVAQVMKQNRGKQD